MRVLGITDYRAKTQQLLSNILVLRRKYFPFFSPLNVLKLLRLNSQRFTLGECWCCLHHQHSLLWWPLLPPFRSSPVPAWTCHFFVVSCTAKWANGRYTCQLLAIMLLEQQVKLSVHQPQEILRAEAQNIFFRKCDPVSSKFKLWSCVFVIRVIKL